MKKWIILVLLMVGLVPLTWAEDGTNQHLSKDEFRAKQKTFITEKAGLTKEEAAKFFPLYFELQDKKKELNDEGWELIKKGRKDELSEAEYAEILEGVFDSRIASDKLEKAYLDKYKKILTYKKIYLVQRAEMRFHRELLKGINDKRGDGQQKGKR